MTDPNHRAELRKSLRAARNRLSKVEQAQASMALERICLELTATHRCFALYLSNDGEIDPKPAINALWQQNKTVALPVLHSFRKGYLNFQQYASHTELPKNQYGIPEPKADSTAILPLTTIDILFMPLVGFDEQGNRLGMGGGYYDRTLANIDDLPQKPTLIGLAHDCQQVERLPIAPWDVPLDMIITPNRKIIIKGNA